VLVVVCCGWLFGGIAAADWWERGIAICSGNYPARSIYIVSMPPKRLGPGWIIDIITSPKTAIFHQLIAFTQ
jgi:hypothetical protein